MPHSPIDVQESAAQQQLAQALEALKTEFKLADGFPPAVLAEVQEAMKTHQLPERDLTSIPFLTIDPPGSLDLDQAMYLTRTATGYLVQYAIADVPSFVAPGGALDGETRRRGQTVYTPEGRIPLHPATLSEGAASLLQDQRRAAFVWDIELDAEGVSRTASVQRATVRSVAKLSYGQAQQMLDSGDAPEPVRGTLELLREIGLKRVELEHRRGGASLNVPRQEVEFDDGRYRLVFRPALPIEDWNAQISLLTGMAAADLMIRGKVGLLRTMPEPDAAALDKYRRQSSALGRPWPEGMAYGDFLRTLDTSDPRQLALMHAAASLFRGAGYVPFDGSIPEQPRQAAVAAPYAHTTAPLRRLVDRFVLVICAALCAGSDVPGWARQALPELPALMMVSDQQANAMDRAAVNTVEAALLSNRIGEQFEAIVVAGPRSNGKSNGSAPRSTIQIQDPAVTAFCEGAPEPGELVRVELITADIPSRTVLFRAL